MINRRLKLGRGLNCPAFAEFSLICYPSEIRLWVKNKKPLFPSETGQLNLF